MYDTLMIVIILLLMSVCIGYILFVSLSFLMNLRKDKSKNAEPDAAKLEFGECVRSLNTPFVSHAYTISGNDKIIKIDGPFRDMLFIMAECEYEAISIDDADDENAKSQLHYRVESYVRLSVLSNDLACSVRTELRARA